MKVSGPTGKETKTMTSKRGKRQSPEQIVRKLRDADAMLNGGKDQAAVLQSLEISEATCLRWRNQYGGMKAEEAKRLKGTGRRKQSAQGDRSRSDLGQSDAEACRGGKLVSPSR